MKKKMRFLSLILSIVLLSTGLPLTAYAAASQDTKATTLRLEAVEGTVGLKNATGKKLTVKDGSKLYSGYTVSTDASSYAWISLDSDVVIKLDASSKATVKQNKKRLEVMLESGKLFFNVSKPIPEDGSLDIRTTSMTTGVRGTSGLVSTSQEIYSAVNTKGEKISSYISASNLIVYEGSVVLTYTAAPTEQSPATSPLKVETTTVTGGFQAEVKKSIAITGSDVDQAITEVNASISPISVKESLTNTGFVAVELSSDEALCKKIAEGNNDTDLSSIEKIAAASKEQLQREQAAAAERMKEQQAALGEALKEVKETAADDSNPSFIVPVFPPPATNPPHSSGSGSSGEDSGEIKPPETCLVTFTAGSAPFATQIVTYGKPVLRPFLWPSKDGNWQLSGTTVNYDFTSPVQKDITLVWNPAAVSAPSN